MTETTCIPCHRRLAAMALLAATALLTFGCTSELASIDDTYVPSTVEENFPIRVVEQPVKLTISASTGKIGHADSTRLLGFSREAASKASTPITVSYPSGSKAAKLVADEAAARLAEAGVARRSILLTPREGKAPEVTLAFGRKVAETKPCGDWSQNIRSDQFNVDYPNFGCAFQQNFAAMVANPEDFQHMHAPGLASSEAQRPALDDYTKGTWQEPTTDTSGMANQ